MADAATTPQTIDLSEYVTQAEAARLLNLHPATLRTRVHRGRTHMTRGSIASIRVGSTVLIPRSEIERVQRTYMPA